MESNPILATLLAAVVVLSLLVCALALWRGRSRDAAGAALAAHLERLERTLVEEARGTRREIADSVQRQGEALLAAQGAVGETQGRRLDAFAVDLAHVRAELRDMLALNAQAMADALGRHSTLQTEQLRLFSEQLQQTATSLAERTDALAAALSEGVTALKTSTTAELVRIREDSQASAVMLRDRLTTALADSSDASTRKLTEIGAVQQAQLDAFRGEVDKLRVAVEARLEAVRAVVEERLRAVQQDNATKLEQMRQTVEEKLQATLETRLGESFRLVSERLEQVARGLGEMQTLATGVGDLKRVLANVKARGTWGEVQLGNLLEQVLAAEQYATNVATNELSGERVEFAIKLPGRSGKPDEVVWLPIDAKFPLEDYQALVDAADRADVPAIEESGRRLEARVKACAKDISSKYVNPPSTTDFAIMFLPVEGLYAEVLRRPGLADAIQREHRIVLAGPTTLLALLNSLQMGFRTLAIERRSSEVWALLGAVKTEFSKFGTVLDGVQKNLTRAASRIEDAKRGTRTITRKLSEVQQLPAAEATGLLDAVVLEIDEELQETV
jgi:DNA recombination protein RmuC